MLKCPWLGAFKAAYVTSFTSNVKVFRAKGMQGCNVQRNGKCSRLYLRLCIQTYTKTTKLGLVIFAICYQCCSDERKIPPYGNWCC